MPTATFTPGKSAHINTLSLGTPLPGAPLGVGNISGEQFRSLLQYDLSSIAPSTTINKAVLIFTNSGVIIDLNRNFAIQRMTQSTWIDGQASWNEYTTGNAWTSPGGDYSTPKNGATFPTSNNQSTFDIKTNVEFAINTGFGNLNFLCKVDVEAGDVFTIMNNPIVRIVYGESAPPPEPTLPEINPKNAYQILKLTGG